MTLIGYLEPLNDLLDDCHLRIEGSLLAPEVAGALRDSRTLSFVVMRNYSAELGGEVNNFFILFYLIQETAPSIPKGYAA
jgi:hypothetical protein